MALKNNLLDVSGQKFGHLIVISRAESDKRGEARWNCICDCGEKSVVLGSHLRSGRVVSCGCYSKEVTSKRIKAERCKPDYKQPHLIHGQSDTRLYKVWVNMKTRCLNAKTRAYKWYGAVGVTICGQWLSFEAFANWATLSGYNDSLTIDRIDPFGNYEPNNCRWVSISEQRKNQRRSYSAIN